MRKFFRADQRFPISRQEKFDCRGIEASAVIQGTNLMALIDAADHHHADQNLDVVDLARVAGEQGFYGNGNCATRRLSGPAKQKSNFFAVPNSNKVRCSGRLMLEMIRCRW